MPSSLDIDLAALTLATAHYRLINEGLIDQPSIISSLDSYQSISEVKKQQFTFLNGFILLGSATI